MPTWGLAGMPLNKTTWRGAPLFPDSCYMMPGVGTLWLLGVI
jgi:hypothetical protein